MSFATIDDLRESLAGPAYKGRDPAYVERMMHDVPDAPVIDRAAFILTRCAGKSVLHVGASGPLHEAILKVGKEVVGIDREGNGKEVLGCDLDDVKGTLPFITGVEVVVCGEVIEHLGNPLHFLKRLRGDYPNVPVIVTVPNAFSEAGRKHMENDLENVNIDHTAWYSYRTLKTLVERAGYKVAEFYWYAPGRPMFCEGLVFVLEGGT